MFQIRFLSLFILGLTLNLNGFSLNAPFNCKWNWQDDRGVVFGKDTMYWTISQKGPAITVDTQSGGNVQLSKTNYADYNWELGWRCLLGYRFGEGRGGIYAVYTSFSEAASGNFIESPNLNGAPVVLKSRNDVDYKTLDLLFTNDFDIQDCGNIRPLFGLRALWLDQSFNTVFAGRNMAGEEVEDRVIRSNYDNFAVGLHGGVEYQFTFKGKWSFYTQMSGSVLSGDIKITERLFENLFPLDDVSGGDDAREGALLLKISRNQTSPIGGIHLGAGFSFESCFLDCAWLRWDIGYELHHWMNISMPVANLENFQPLLNPTPSSGMTIHGIVFRGTYFF